MHTPHGQRLRNGVSGNIYGAKTGAPRLAAWVVLRTPHVAVSVFRNSVFTEVTPEGQGSHRHPGPHKNDTTSCSFWAPTTHPGRPCVHASLGTDSWSLITASCTTHDEDWLRLPSNLPCRQKWVTRHALLPTCVSRVARPWCLSGAARPCTLPLCRPRPYVTDRPCPMTLQRDQGGCGPVPAGGASRSCRFSDKPHLHRLHRQSVRSSAECRAVQNSQPQAHRIQSMQ